jgi:putative acetyltransferase
MVMTGKGYIHSIYGVNRFVHRAKSSPSVTYISQFDDILWGCPKTTQLVVSSEIMNIRIATNQDRDDIQRVHLCAFPEGESKIVSKLATDLLSEKTTPQIIVLVAEADGAIVGHIAFSPVIIDNNENFRGYILAPLGVKPNYQKRRIGSKLIEYGMEHLSALRVNVVFVYGDPKYYGRFGFSADAAQRYTTPYKLQYPFGWQAIVLNESDIEKPPVTIACVTSLRDPKLW